MASSTSAKTAPRGQASATTPGTARFEALDAVRGVCAFMVMCRHTELLTRVDPFPSSYMAVDLFFMMSGFVIAYAYEERLGRGGYFGTFVYRRYARLWPMWAIGLSIGAALPLALALRGHGSLIDTLVDYGASLVFLPHPTQGDLFDLNVPGWSLFFELVANFVWALLIAVMSRAVLAVTVAVSAAGLVWAAFATGDLNGGWALTWPSMGVGALRVSFGFLLGVLFFHLPRPRRFTRLGIVPLCLTLLVLAAAFRFRPDAAMRPWFDVGVSLLVLPATIWVALKTPLQGSWWAETLGLISYPLYTIHFGLFLLISLSMSGIFYVDPQLDYGTVAGVVAGVVAIAYLLGRFVDPAIQRWLGRVFHKRPIELPSPRR